MAKKASTNLSTGPSLKLGVLGGGQLGRMMIQSAIDLDVRVEVMDPSPDAPCSSLTHRFVCADLNDADAVFEFGKDLDVITIEIENVSVEGLKRLEQSGVRTVPKPKHIELIQDKGIQKQFFVDNNIATSEFQLVEESGDVNAFGFPVVQKLRKGGYDGKGVLILKSAEEATETRFKEKSLIERKIAIDKELSVIVARNASGEITSYPVVESIFDPVANLVSSLVAPASIDEETEKKARELAMKVVDVMQFEGLMAVELFLNMDGKILVNEVAPRTHNSGHHTIEGNRTSQFAQHIRTVANFPLGSTAKLHEAAGMINLLGAEGAYGFPVYEGLGTAIEIEGVNLHLYGKSQVKPHRKMGHITVTGSSIEEVQNKLLKLQSFIRVTGTE
ncbi:MAG: 5-(carboxyamino)imidazole ribonucleotide synthase [Bacteroidota bacterium]|nr:5-(carboxyamino)imidazole ribonucleotide synthase [Bacteroidota bacterium]